LAGGWLSGRYRRGQAVSGPGSAARAERSAVYDATNPANAAKFDAADALGVLADEAGLTLIQMATAFVIRHPAVTSAIIGPRTIDHMDSYLAADGIELPSDLLDRIDQIVPPGVTINVADNMWHIGTRALTAEFRRRSPAASFVRSPKLSRPGSARIDIQRLRARGKTRGDHRWMGYGAAENEKTPLSAAELRPGMRRKPAPFELSQEGNYKVYARKLSPTT
jgi:hypothetical protein